MKCTLSGCTRVGSLRLGPALGEPDLTFCDIRHIRGFRLVANTGGVNMTTFDFFVRVAPSALARAP